MKRNAKILKMFYNNLSVKSFNTDNWHHIHLTHELGKKK